MTEKTKKQKRLLKPSVVDIWILFRCRHLCAYNGWKFFFFGQKTKKSLCFFFFFPLLTATVCCFRIKKKGEGLYTVEMEEKKIIYITQSVWSIIQITFFFLFYFCYSIFLFLWFSVFVNYYETSRRSEEEETFIGCNMEWWLMTMNQT